MYSKERKRFPQELFLPGFPTRDNLQAGTEDSQPPLTIPPPDRPGGVLIPQLNPYFMAKQPRKQTENQIPVLQGNGFCIIMRRYFQKIR
ncbi:hypothetical protein V3C10_19800 [[Clostridium] symbiosum]|uniref:hypothetical protein n=1 Tax=Clostridium symbiosum TaxID=1512 RepID=UPI001D0729E2|nr:hypothetical protein [[Clostridium] symbiosum]MCB6930439.1 hypothetical protein [[Clostridium] symbiosum]